MMLRVLADGPRHGYEIKKHVERILGGRSINNNVLYPALRRFEEQGAIERVAAEADPGRPPRNVYRLTDAGHDQLQAMIRDADPPCWPTTTSSRRASRSSPIWTRLTGSRSSRYGGPSLTRRSPTWRRCGRMPSAPRGGCGSWTSAWTGSATSAPGWTRCRRPRQDQARSYGRPGRPSHRRHIDPRPARLPRRPDAVHD